MEEISKTEASALSTAALAYLGDAVWEVEIRRRLVCRGVSQPSEKALAYVTAGAQSDAVEKLLEHLTEEEEAIYRRGRNSVHGNVPKSATVAQYRRATGLEALFGYLELSGQRGRIAQLFDVMFPEEQN